MIFDRILPTPPEQAARYLGTGFPETLTAYVFPDGIVLQADYPYDEETLYAELAALGIERAATQYSPCG